MKTIYLPYPPYTGYYTPVFKDYAKRNRYRVKQLSLDSKPSHNDIVIYTDVASFIRNPPRWMQLFKFWRQNMRLVLILFEPPVVLPYNYIRIFHKPFRLVYTWNDDLARKKKYRKFLWPQHEKGRKMKAVPFKKKKLLTIFCANKQPALPFYPNSLYEKRVSAMRFFEKNLPGEFACYGNGWDKPVNIREKIFGAKGFKSWQGWVDNKLANLAKYKFCICYENMSGKNGYMTEKVWDAFKARCVPIYWGAENIYKYIPKGSFIDRRNFKSDNEVLDFIQRLTEKEYNKYIKKIEEFMRSKRFDQWLNDKVGTKIMEENK